MKYLLFILIIIFIFGYVYYFHFKNEKFINVIPDKGVIDDTVIDSLPITNEVSSKYKNNYYYEYDNVEYERLLNDIFSRPSNNINKIKSYNAFLNYITDTLNNSYEFKNIQIVQDRQLDNNNIEVLLYRENKFEGKHVVFTIQNISANEWNITLIKIVGSVSEDKIGLFPVFPLNPSDDDYLVLTNNINENGNIIISKSSPLNTLPQNETVVDDNKQKDKMLKISKHLFNNSDDNLKITNNVLIENEMSEDSMYVKYKFLDIGK